MKPRVLMIAYACDPEGGGEHWLGWGWAEQAAHNYEVELITTPKAQANVEKACKEKGIIPHFVELPSWFRRLTEVTGASWWRKLAWQKRVLRLAEARHHQKPFSLIHQTTFHTFRAPFLATQLRVPSVWGPIAGGEYVPPGFEHYLGPARFSERNRAMLNRLTLHVPSVARSLQQATTIFVSNRTTLRFLPSAIQPKCQIVPPNALRAEDEKRSPPAQKPPQEGRIFKLLYVGNCVATRAIPLVLKSLAALTESGFGDFHFDVVGDGPALNRWKWWVAVLRLEAKVTFVGKIPYAQLDRFYSTADVLVFPALRDSGGSALLEAMARYVPVVCLDWGGPAEMVDEQSGIKVPVTSPEASERGFADALKRLYQDVRLGSSLAQKARLRAETLFGWPAKRQLLERTYQGLLDRRSPRS